MLAVDDWAEIRRLHFAEGWAIKRIARELGVARNTVRAAVRSDRPPVYERTPSGSVVDAVEVEVRRLLQSDPRMPATVIAERIGWDRGMTVLRDRVRELRPVFAPVDPVQRTSYLPGELAQFDLWLPEVDIPLGHGQVGRLWVEVAVLGFSRLMAARLIGTRETHDVLAGHWACLRDLGGVPRLVVWDGEGAIGRRRGRTFQLTQAFQTFRGTLGMGAFICERGDPEAKGLVERANRYLETSFLPGRTFTSPADFDAQLQDWLATRANVRRHRILQARPIDLAAEDRSALRPLPPVAPDVVWRSSVRLPRDHYVRFDTCDYSVHPSAIGQRVDVVADLDWVVATTRDGVEVARHLRRFARHSVVTEPAHARARRQLRDAYRHQHEAAEVEVEIRDLAVYDHTLGVA